MKALTLPVALVLSIAAVPARAGVVINEILYHAPDDLAVEFVELHNAGDAAVDLSGWKLRGGASFTFPAATSISAGGHALLVRKPALLERLHGGDLPVLGELEGSLSNGGDTLLLVNAAGEIVDAVSYRDRAPWPVSADGGSASLERICPSAPGGLAANWAPSPLSDNARAKPSGTPGARNRAFSVTLPPVVRDLSVTPRVAKPGASISVSARVESASGALASVETLYRVVEPGKVGEERSLEMERGPDGLYSARIPGPEANRIVRVRVQAVDAAGATRIAPPEFELRPAESVWVGGPVDAGTIPVMQFFNAGEAEHRAASEYVRGQRRPSGRGPGRGGFDPRRRFSEEDRLRMDARRSLSTEPLARAFAALAFQAELDAERRMALLAPFRAASDRLHELSGELEEARDVAEFSRALPQKLTSLRTRLLEDAKRAVRGAELGEGVTATLGSIGIESGQRGRERGRRGFDPSRLLDVDALIFGAVIAPDLSAEQLEHLRELHRDAVANRDALSPGEGREGFRELFERAREAREALDNAIAGILDETQLASIRDAEPERGGFGRRGGFGGRGFNPFSTSSSAPLPGQGRSALVFTDPASGETTLHDFVHIVQRKSGYKVRFQKDRPLDDKTTLNVLHERDPRSMLGESLSYELYRLAGNPTPGASYARVVIDGAVAGHHLVFEQPNGAFFRRHGRAGGNVYKVIWQGSNRPSRFTPAEKIPDRDDVIGRHEKKSNPHDGYEDIVELVEALEGATEAAELWRVIQDRFEVDEVINYFAVNTLLSHWDGFFNNYFLLHDIKGGGKWSMYPWDQDSTWGHRMSRGDEVFAEMPLTFGMEGDAPPGAPRDREQEGSRRGRGGRGGFGFGGFRGGASWWRPGGEISRPLLANPQFRRRYLDRLEELAKTVYTEDVFGPKLDALRSSLEAEVRLRARNSERAEDEALRELDESLAFFREHLVKRRAFVLDAIAKERGEE